MAGRERIREQIPKEILEKCWSEEAKRCPCFKTFKSLDGLQCYCHRSFFWRIRKRRCQLPTDLTQQ